MRICFAAFLLMFVLINISGAQETNFAVGPQYLMTSGSPLFAQPIATPSLSLGEAVPQTGANKEIAEHVAANDEVLNSILELQRQMTLPSIYYGWPRISVVEISFREPSRQYLSSLPVSIVESGVVETTDVQALRVRGYGVTLPEAAAYWKAHKVSAPRSYTNSDIERLRNGN